MGLANDGRISPPVQEAYKTKRGPQILIAGERFDAVNRYPRARREF